MLGFRNHTIAQQWALGVIVVHILGLCVIIVGIFSNILKMNGIFNVSDLKHIVNKTSTESITSLQQDHVSTNTLM